jgi:hypothetical protein
LIIDSWLWIVDQGWDLLDMELGSLGRDKDRVAVEVGLRLCRQLGILIGGVFQYGGLFTESRESTSLSNE